MEVSVAFQGGGAKVIELMAAAVACRKVQEAGTFEIKRVSGVSAGAIAAAMYATGCDIQKVIDNAGKLEIDVKSKFPKKRLTKFRAALRLFQGQPIFDEADVRKLIVKIFGLGGIDAEKPIKELTKGRNVELRIIYSDIRFNQIQTLKEDAVDRLADALTNSTAIPFAFRFPGSSGNPEMLDGGLFQNLPAKAALDGLAIGQTVLGLSFEKDQPPDLVDADPFVYGMAILDSLITERIEDAANQIKPTNVINLPKRRTTFEFAKIFSSNLHSNFSQDVSEISDRLTAWARSLRGANGLDWHSNHPFDLAQKTAAMETEVTRFYEELGLPGYDAESIHHEITYQSFNKDMPDIYKTKLALSGAKNPGFQFLRFFFYDSDEGPLASIKVEVFDQNNNPRKAMTLPFRVPGERARATLVCLDTPLKDGETITIVKTEESFLGMGEYLRDGFTLETVVLDVGRAAAEVSITVHFPTTEFPQHYHDASLARPKDAKKLKILDGQQLPTTIHVDTNLRVGCKSVICKGHASGLTESPRFVSVSFYK